MDRFAIIEGHYWHAVHNHGGQGSKLYEKLCRIQEYYSPGRTANGPTTWESWYVYNKLSNVTGYHNCQCRDCFETCIGPDPICDGCSEHGCEPDHECQRPDAYGGEEEEGEEEDFDA